MRRYHRPPLKPQANRYLSKKTREVRLMETAQRKREIRRIWDQARQTKSIKKHVLQALRGMVGKRERCMYCEDSRGTDIDHFWPKSTYPEKTFDWPNMLLSCTPCQRAKGDSFPLDATNQPLLIDPTREDPWAFLFFVPETGMVTPRYNKDTEQEEPKGSKTVELLPLNVEAVTEGRKATHRNLVAAVTAFLSSSGDHGENPDPQAVTELKRAVRDNSQYGLAVWSLSGDGQRREPFQGLKSRHPGLLDDLRACAGVARERPGPDCAR